MSRRSLIASSITAVCALLIVMRLGTWLFPFEARARSGLSNQFWWRAARMGCCTGRPFHIRGARSSAVEGRVVVELDIDEHGLVSARALSGRKSSGVPRYSRCWSGITIPPSTLQASARVNPIPPSEPGTRQLRSRN
jgi:hypothetical protein